MPDTPTVAPAAPAAPPAKAPQTTNSPFHQVAAPDRASDFKPIQPSTGLTDAQYDLLMPTERLAYARAATAAASTAPAPATTPESKPGGSAGNVGTLAVTSLGELAADGSQQLRIGEGDSAIQISQKQLQDTMAWKAAEDARRATLPASPADYRLELPQEFNAPAGIKFKFDEADPLTTQSRTLANKHKLTQEAYSDFLGLYAGAKVNEQQQIDTAVQAEIGKLGPAAPARVGNIKTFLDANGVSGLKDRILTAQDVQDWEKLMGRFISGGGATFNTSHREPGGTGMTDAQWARMSSADKVEYARSHPQPQPTNGRGR